MSGPERNLLSVARTAALIGISPHTLRSWLRQRRLPHVRLGRRILFDPRDLEEFVAANRVAARGEGR
jgi:excisionase family DNA binding protein